MRLRRRLAIILAAALVGTAALAAPAAAVPVNCHYPGGTAGSPGNPITCI